MTGILDIISDKDKARFIKQIADDKGELFMVAAIRGITLDDAREKLLNDLKDTIYMLNGVFETLSDDNPHKEGVHKLIVDLVNDLTGLDEEA